MDRVLSVLQIILVALIAAIVVAYAGDYLSVRYRMAQNKGDDPLETIKIEPTYAIPHKNGSAEIVIGDAESETCVRSLFPHMGFAPCWYLKRTSKDIIMLDIVVTRQPAS